MKIKLLLMIVLALTNNGILSSQTIIIKNAWARPAAKYANSALYFVLVNNASKSDTLLGVETKVAEETQIHETFKKDNDRIGMRPAGKIAIKPKSNFEFKAGGFHIMLLGAEKDLKIGDKIEIVLLFKNAGKVKFKTEISDTPTTN